MKLRWQLARPQLGFDLLRVYLGIGLCVRGALILKDPALLAQFIDNDDWLFPMLIAHGVVLAHTVGGLLLALGCYTRWAAAVQLPPVAAALFFVHWHEGLFSRTQSLELSALVLFALGLYAAFGSAELSVDHYLARARQEAGGIEPVFTFRSHPGEPRPSPGPPAPDELPLPADPPYARARYRDLKLELTLLLVAACVLFVLLGMGQYLLAPMWLIAATMLFVIWRIGRTHFEGE